MANKPIPKEVIEVFKFCYIMFGKKFLWWEQFADVHKDQAQKYWDTEFRIHNPNHHFIVNVDASLHSGIKLYATDTRSPVDYYLEFTDEFINEMFKDE